MIVIPKKILISIFFLTILIIFSSCATLYTGNKSIIHFSSNPQSAEVRINDKLLGVTPLTVKVKRTLKKKVVTFKKDGYTSKSFKLNQKFKTISLLSNVLIPIDALSGAIVDYPNHFYHFNLKQKGSGDTLISPYNLKDNFFVISSKDTFYTNPFQQLHYKSIFSNKIDKIDFKLLDGKETSLSAADVVRYKTLGIYKKGIGAFFLYCQTSQDYMYKTYIPALVSENVKKNKKLFMFMEELLINKDYHLLKSYEIVTSVNSVSPSISTNSGAAYFLYKEGEMIQKIEQKELVLIVESTFSDHKELIEELKKKNKFKVLEKYVYKDKKRADKQWFPY